MQISYPNVSRLTTFTFILQFSLAFPVAAKPFRDTQQHWAADCIDRLADLRQLNGYPDATFRPENQLTRAEYAVLMLNSFPNTIAISPTLRPIPNFKDLSPQHWAYRALRLAYQKRIFTGYPDNTMRPDRPITRVEAISILYNLVSPTDAVELTYSNLPRFPIPKNPTQVLTELFEDAKQTPAWAYSSIAGASAGFMVVDYPKGNKLRPQQPTTRAEAAAFLCQSAELDGLIPIEAVPGYRKFHRSPALKKLLRSKLEGKPSWFDREKELTIIPVSPPGWKILSIGKLSEATVAAWFEDSKQGQKQGFLDREGRLKIAPQFEAVGSFSEGLAWVKQGDKFGFIDQTGIVIVPPQFDEAQTFSEGLAAIRQGQEWGFIDRTGAVIIPLQPHAVSPFSEGLARIQVASQEPRGLSRYGFIDRTGKVVIEPRFNRAESFSSGLAIEEIYPAEIGGPYQLGYIDRTGKFALQDLEGTGPESFSEGLAARQINGEYGYIDPTGNWVIKPQTLSSQAFGQIQQAGSFQAGFATVKIGDRFGIINRQGKLVVEPIYSAIQEIAHEYAYVNYGGSWVSYIGGYDSSAVPMSEQTFLGGRWGYIKLPQP